MPEIALPTAVKQNEILERVRSKTVYPSKTLKANFAANNTSTFKDLINITGEGELLEIFLRNNTVLTQMKIIIDGSVHIEVTSDANGKNIAILLSDYTFFASTFFSALSWKSFTGANSLLQPATILGEPISFKKSLQIQATGYENDSMSHILYHLK